MMILGTGEAPMAEKNHKDAVEIAGRVTKLLRSTSISPEDLKNDKYTGRVRIKTWRKRGKPKS